MKFKENDRVRMLDNDRYCHGRITIIKKNEGFIRNIPYDSIICKVLFNEDWAPNYWYYPESELELMESEE